MPISARRLAWEAMSFMAHGVGSLRRTDSVAIEGIADIRRSLAARRSDANDPKRTFRLYDLPLFAPSFIATGPFARQLAKLSRVIMFDASILVSNEPVDCTKRQDGCRKREKLR